MTDKNVSLFNGLLPTPVLDREPTWVDVAKMYGAPRECLAAILVTFAAEVLAGAKPANLVSLVKRTLPCGVSTYQLWQSYGEELLNDSPLRAIPLRTTEKSILLLIYHPVLLEKRLSSRTMQAFLGRCGYPGPMKVDNILNHLGDRFRSCDIPHEIGMFLGYPLKDVIGFIEQRENGWEGHCLWRVYGPPKRSLSLYRRYCSERRKFTARLISGAEPFELLKAA